MRIGIFDPYLNTLTGGEKYMLTGASCLSKKHEVSVFWDEEGILDKASERFNLDLSRVKLEKNIFNQDAMLPQKYLKTNRFDAILYLSDGSLPFVACDLYVHFQFPVEWVNAKSFYSRLKISRVKKVICNSSFTKKFIDKKFSVESVVLYPPTFFKKDFPLVDLDKKKNYILNVGRLTKSATGEYYKKQDLLIKSFIDLVKKGLTNWELILVVSFLEEDRKLVKELKELAKGYPIRILENYPYEKLREVYKESKIYWHASGFGEDLVNYPEKAEHFGITTVEAMANGLVPVVIDAGGQKEIVKEGIDGYLWETEKELINKTNRLIKNEGLWRSLSVDAVKKSKKFTTDNFCEKLYEIFEIE